MNIFVVVHLPYSSLIYKRFTTTYLHGVFMFIHNCCGPGNVVGTEIEFRRGRDFTQLSRPALGPTQPPVQLLPGLSGGKEQPRRDADPSPLLVPWSRKSRAIPLLLLWAVRPVKSLSACTEPQCLYKGALYFFYTQLLHVSAIYRVHLQGVSSLEVRSV